MELHLIALLGRSTRKIEIPDKLLLKTIAVIDEILDRTYDDGEERSFDSLKFPLVPYPFFEKYRSPDNVGVDDYWMLEWIDTTLSKNITERSEIIHILYNLGSLSINKDPIINITTGHFDGENFDLKIDRTKLLENREKLIEGYEKLKLERSNNSNKKQALSNNEEVAIKDVRLDEEGHFLEITKINGEEIIIPFKSKKKGKEQGNETKLFKLLYPLFDKKWHRIKGKIVKKGEYYPIDTLMQLTNCLTEGALKQHIKRLNKSFKDKLIPINIKCAGRSCKLIVDFTEKKVS